MAFLALGQMSQTAPTSTLLLSPRSRRHTAKADDERKCWAWVAAAEIPGIDTLAFRRDCDGRIIHWDEYGKYSDYGWHIDHEKPLALGGADMLLNLRARHWRGNTRAGGLLGSVFA
jgi:hypothetical protein